MKSRIKTILLFVFGVSSVLGATKLLSKDLFTKSKENLVLDVAYSADQTSLEVDIFNTNDIGVYTLAFDFKNGEIEVGALYYGYGVSISVEKIENKVNDLKIYRYDFRPLLQKDVSMDLKKIYIPLIDKEDLLNIEQIKAENKFYFYKGIEMPYNLKFKEVVV